MRVKIATPREPVYYYECSAGRYRLVYFLPTRELKRLRSDGRLTAEALEDLPDGVDIGCTEPDFAEFESQYGYRPPHDPEALKRAFFAIFSTTQGWKSFRGSGWIPARDLVAQLETVEAELESAAIEPPAPAPLPRRTTLRQRRKMKRRQSTQKQRLQTALERMPAQGIDPGRNLAEQRFSDVEMEEGKPAEQIFTEIHLKQRRNSDDR